MNTTSAVGKQNRFARTDTFGFKIKPKVYRAMN